MGLESAVLISGTAGGVSELAGGVVQAQALRAQGQYQKTVADFNAAMFDLKAKDALARGREAATQAGIQSRKQVARQRAAAAAGNIDVQAGTVLDIQAETAFQGELDEARLLNNARREALGFGVQAFGARLEGRQAERGGRFAATSTLLASGLKFTQEGLFTAAVASELGSGGLTKDDFARAMAARQVSP